MTIHLAEDTITRSDTVALSEWLLRTEKLTKGPLTDEFEAAFAEALGAEHAVAVNSGSSANLIAAAALRYGDRAPRRTVIAPAVSWVTTVTPFMQLGYDVVLCDADRRTLGLDVDHLEQLCEQHRPDVVILVHVLGHSSDVARVREICDAHGATLIEDSCEAIGSRVDGQALGTFGTFGTFSFYFGHQISTIEGGMLVTDDFEMAQVARSLRAHGWARDLDPSTRRQLETAHDIDPFQSLYTFYYPGFNCRSTDLNAFLGLRQLQRLDAITAARHTNHLTYVEQLPGFFHQASDTDELSSFAFGTLVSNRDEVAAALNAADVECRPLICGNVGRQPFMADIRPTHPLPVADLVHDDGIYVPNHPGVTADDIERICAVIRAVGRPVHPEQLVHTA